MAKIFSKYSGKKENNYVLPAGSDGRRSGKALSIWKEGVKTCMGREIQMLSKRQENFQDAIEGKPQRARQSEWKNA